MTPIRFSYALEHLKRNVVGILAGIRIAVLFGRLHDGGFSAAGHRLHFKVSGGCLGSFHQIVDQAFQALGLPEEHSGVLFDLRVFAGFFADQVRIVDDRGQRRLQVVRNVGDQFGLHAFAL